MMTRSASRKFSIIEEIPLIREEGGYLPRGLHPFRGQAGLYFSGWMERKR
jgi:hypothetical protein